MGRRGVAFWIDQCARKERGGGDQRGGGGKRPQGVGGRRAFPVLTDTGQGVPPPAGRLPEGRALRGGTSVDGAGMKSARRKAPVRETKRSYSHN